MSKEIDVNALIPPGPLREALLAQLQEVDARIAETATNYKFIMQMIGGDTGIPSLDLLTVIIAKAYAGHIAEWDGTMMLPVLFARLTALEITR